MRALLLVIFTFLTTVTVQGQSQIYYWYQDEIQPLEVKDDKWFLLVEDELEVQALAQILQIEQERINDIVRLEFSETLLPQIQSITERDRYWTVVNADGQTIDWSNPVISYFSPFFYTQSGQEAGLSHLFNVKLNNSEDIGRLEEMAVKYGVEILGNNYFMPLWYTLACNRSSAGNALEMANLFYESGYFKAAVPDLMSNALIQNVNDPFFENQWNLHNTGQYGGFVGSDIQAIDAWQITRSNSIIVTAILDMGLQMNHPDLPNIHPESFDSEFGFSPSLLHGNHGVAVGGIAGANSNNNEGVAGIAPDGLLMSISNSLGFSPNSRMGRADGINFAWENGAHIINNSWTIGPLQIPEIDDAIENALTQGRGGLGTVVVFSTGNDNEDFIYYPSENPNVIAVGASSMCDERASPTSCDTENWGSNFGEGINVVAPGVLISTTDRDPEGYNPSNPIHPNPIVGGTILDYNDEYENQYYTIWFNGTSAAAPHVSGIASLILSINDDLTFDEVRYIIESSAEKVGNYTYTLGAGARPDLTWNEEMGYGRVNAYRALIGTIENHGATLGIEKPLVTLPLYEDIDFHEDVYLASGSSLTIEARDNPVTLTSNSGSITIGKPASGTTQAKPLAGGGDDSGGDEGEIGSETPQKIALSANYPNPFNPVTNIRYELPQNSHVQLKVYDILGRRVAVLVDGMIEAGVHEAVFDASNLASGVYLYRLSTADFVQTRQMVLVK